MTTTPSLRTRVLLIDFIKALAAQIIVLHHLAWYGPLSDQAVLLGPLWHGIDAGLANYGRYAVAVFIVTAGFLAAQLLKQHSLLPTIRPGCLIVERYVRLVVPFVAALLLAVACGSLARPWLPDDSVVGPPPQLLQFLAHIFLLHGVLGVESLSAGVWYVAIDFQLYALLVLLLWAARSVLRRPASADFWGSMPVLLVALVSLFHFNRDVRWDSTALYFFGIYCLGVGSGWAIRSPQRSRFLWIVAIAGVLALLIDFRPRVAIALVTALMLGSGIIHMTRWEVRLVHYLGGTSYALFLVHFPVFLLGSAIVHHLWPGDPAMNAVGLVVIWGVSNLVAHFFHRWVELPASRWQKRLLPCGAHAKPAIPAGQN